MAKCGIRDPVHRWIDLSPHEMAVVDSPFVQRLRHVKQLGAVDHVFPCGLHTRFSHSLGVMHLAGIYGSHLYPNDPRKVQVARLAGLLHDIGHGPFSHCFDDVVYTKLYPGITHHGHDWHRLQLVRHSEMVKLLSQCGVELDEILAVWDGRNKVAMAFLQGPCGCDRMDFLLRDSYFTGTSQFGLVASDRIIAGSIIKEHADEGLCLHYQSKVMDDVFTLLLGRFHMYKAVYHNKACTAADILVREMLTASCEPLNLVERTADLEKFKYLSDITLIGEIMCSTAPNMNRARYFCELYLSRTLPKLRWERIVPFVNKDSTEEMEIFSKARAHLECGEKQSTPPVCVFAHDTLSLATVDGNEFDQEHVYIDHIGESICLKQYLDIIKYFQPFVTSESRYVIRRLYEGPRVIDHFH